MLYGRTLICSRLSRRDARGASAVEYGLLLAGIASVIVLVVFAFGGTIQDIFQDTSDSIGNTDKR